MHVSHSLRRATLFLLILWSTPLILSAASLSGCAEKKAHLLSTFERGIASIRRRITEVETEVVLSPATKANFTQEGEWLIAWMQDQSERISSLPDCSELPQLAENALLQVSPVEKASRMMDATKLLWEVDRLSEHVRAALAPSSISAEMRQDLSDALTKLGDARTIFLTLSEDPGKASEFSPQMRQGIFLIRQSLRPMRFHGILD